MTAERFYRAKKLWKAARLLLLLLVSLFPRQKLNVNFLSLFGLLLAKLFPQLRGIIKSFFLAAATAEIPFRERAVIRNVDELGNAESKSRLNEWMERVTSHGGAHSRPKSPPKVNRSRTFHQQEELISRSSKY